jgi:two-component sensor histidine kinase
MVPRSKFFTVAIHVLIWLGLFLIPFIDERQHLNIDFILRVGFTFSLLAGSFYFNFYFLIPRLFLRRKFIYFFLAALGTLIFIAAINTLYVYLLGPPMFSGRHHANYSRLFLNTFFPAFFVFTVSTAIKISNEWFKTEKQKKEMENEKLHAELAFLKSQVNPHFLFNILNNICSLARKKSDDTENAVIKLSQIMRYMLSESQDEKVNLEKEVEYLKNYIELQQLRVSGKVKINFSVEGSPGILLIEPMLLIPFVENAFKHGISYAEDSEIGIFLKISENELDFRTENSIFRNGNEIVASDSGTGLKNVLRRLELLYPGKHEILITDNGKRYIVELKIKFAS